VNKGITIYISNSTHVILLLTMFILISASGCSIKRIAINSVADSLAGNSTVYAADNDIQLVAEATPFALKTIESLLASVPDHKGLLLSAAKGFTQYAYAYVQLPADELEQEDLIMANAERERALKLYLRARDYGLHGLSTDHPGFTANLRQDPVSTLSETGSDDVALLYWTAAAWGAAISLGKDNPYLLADIPSMEALMTRALEIDEKFEHGAIHVFFISYEMSRRTISDGAGDRAQQHFKRAVELSQGLQASPYVAMAESFYIPMQDRDSFSESLEIALAINVDEHKEWRLANLIMQRRARIMLSRIDEFFIE